MKRREFLTLLGGTATLWPVAAQAQQARPVPVVGLVSVGASPGDPANFGPFLEQMRALGYIDGQNIVFDRRFAAGQGELIDGFVADLVRLPVDNGGHGNQGEHCCQASNLVDSHRHDRQPRSDRYGFG